MYVKMTLVLNIPVGSFAVLLKSILPHKTANSILLGPFYPLSPPTVLLLAVLGGKMDFE